jgi:transcriptional regulator with PAS, ATPase and Fis domain
MSDRKKMPFVTVNCGAIPESLLESEFFGHKKGSFSGAHSDRAGFLEAARGGTLFLDEIGEMPLAMQVKLLRALDGKGFTPVGDNRVRQADFRLISATNRNPKQMVRDGAMREDFYYRINTVPIQMPPLRERKEDIPLLINHFLSVLSDNCGKEIELPTEVQVELNRHRWPGNVRELQNVLNRYLTLNEVSFAECVEDFEEKSPEPAPSVVPKVQDAQEIPQALDTVEKKMIEKVLEQNRWNVTQSAKAMKISRRTLQRRIKKYGLKT